MCLTHYKPIDLEFGSFLIGQAFGIRHLYPARGSNPQLHDFFPEEQVAGLFPNGQALWIHDRGDRFLYTGNDGYWYLGVLTFFSLHGTAFTD